MGYVDRILLTMGMNEIHLRCKLVYRPGLLPEPPASPSRWNHLGPGTIQNHHLCSSGSGNIFTFPSSRRAFQLLTPGAVGLPVYCTTACSSGSRSHTVSILKRFNQRYCIFLNPTFSRCSSSSTTMMLALLCSATYLVASTLLVV